jgi:DNA polymerase III subunit epsilon
VDLELTGLDPERDEIISFGAIPIEDGRLKVGESVTGLVRPTRELNEDSIRIHGIRAADLEAAPILADAIGPLLEVLAGRVPVAHTAAVERLFLGRALRERGTRLRGPIADTELLGRLWLHERDGKLWRRLPLTLLAGELGLPAERPHDALGDALTTGQAFIVLATHLDGIRRETVATITSARRRVNAIRVFHVG